MKMDLPLKDSLRPVAPNVFEAALYRLGRFLNERNYRFTTVTPATHRTVYGRGPARDASLRDIFGWNRPFSNTDLPSDLLAELRAAEIIVEESNGLLSKIRYSSLGDNLFAHSGFPTAEADSVFFGPDTYRFTAWAEGELTSGDAPRRILEIGCGSGAAGIRAALSLSRQRPVSLVLSDINDRALAFSRVNARLAGVTDVEFVHSDVLRQITGSFDLILANPPYLLDDKLRVYRHGGGEMGSGLSLRILKEALPRLSPKGKLLLYTGSCFIDGEDIFLNGAAPLLNGSALHFSYREIDPDVFGETLTEPWMHAAERIAAVGLSVQKTDTH